MTSRRSLTSHLLSAFHLAGHVCVDVPSYGMALLVHRSTSGPPYRCTRFELPGELPIGHSEHETAVEACEEVWWLVGHAAEVGKRWGEGSEGEEATCD